MLINVLIKLCHFLSNFIICLFADGKKGSVHVATPHPSKKGGKTPGSDKSPKSGGQASCGPCKK